MQNETPLQPQSGARPGLMTVGTAFEKQLGVRNPVVLTEKYHENNHRYPYNFAGVKHNG